MTAQKTVNINVGGGLLGFAFIILKVTGYVSWPWLWVLCPFWIPWCIVAAVIAVPLALAGLVGLGLGILTFVSWLNNYIKRKWQ